MNYKSRRRALGITVGVVVAGLLAAAAAVSFAVTAAPAETARMNAEKIHVNVPSLTHVIRVPEHVTMRTAAQVPVLAYHAMNDKCAAAAPICKSTDYESVSLKQFTDEMNWLYIHGYHTVNPSQYVAWLRNQKTLLPSNPVLLVDDNGDSNFLLDAEQTLYHYRYTVTAVIVTGFADAATTGQCAPHVKADGHLYNVQVGCPVTSKQGGWNATWAQMKALSPQVYNYALEAGPSGHYVQDYSKNCPEYYTCKMPGESNSTYERRVVHDIQIGLAELVQQLPGRVNTDIWTVPYSDLGYPCTAYSCPDESSTGPAGWLISLAAVHFKAVFVQTPSRNDAENERFRYEIQSTTTLQQFRQAIGVYLRDGAWKV
jgi:hypothetical protein